MTKLLVLEHSKSVRNNLKERLEFEGYATQTAEDYQTAIAQTERGDIDLIIADDPFAVPDTDTPFIIISSSSSLDSAVEAVRRGAVDFLTKPVDMTALWYTPQCRLCRGRVGRYKQP